MFLAGRLQATTGVLFRWVIRGEQRLGLPVLEDGDERVVGKDRHEDNENDQNETKDGCPVSGESVPQSFPLAAQSHHGLFEGNRILRHKRTSSE